MTGDAIDLNKAKLDPASVFRAPKDVLGAAGLSAPGTLYAAMTAQVRSKQTLLPLLLFPLIVPALLAAVKATSLVVLGDPMQQVTSWISLLVAFDAIYWSLCGILYSRVVEE